VEHEHIVSRTWIWRKRRTLAAVFGDSKDRELTLRKGESLCCVVYNVNTERTEKTENAPSFSGAWPIVIPGDRNDDRFRERFRESCELMESVNDRRIHRPHRMKDVASDDYDIWAQLDHAIDRASKDGRDIRFPLIDPCRGQPMILPEAKMQVGEMD
jgi:hypothetical protein